MNKAAVAYIRVSTEQQAVEGVSLIAQREKVEAYCKLQGLELVAVIEDQGVSGAMALGDRPGGALLQAELKKHKARHVVALKLDRLFRDAADALVQTKAWDEQGIGLHLIDIGGQSINTSTAMGRMFLTMMSGFAELERNLISERTALALQSKKQRREVYAPIPLGYMNAEGKLVAVDEELLVVAEIRDMRAEGKTLREIADNLNGRGIIGKRGGKFFASTVKAVLENSLHR